MHFTLADLVTDIAQNAVEAGASLVELDVTDGGGEFRFFVKDNGKGMTNEELKRAIDPFVTDGIKHPGRKVGLGLPFLLQTAMQSNGGWSIKSEKGKGTTVTGWFDSNCIDIPPTGDIAGMFRTVFMFDSPAEIIIRRKKVKEKSEGVNVVYDEYEVCKSEIAEALGSLEEAGALVLMDRYLRSLEQEDEEDEHGKDES